MLNKYICSYINYQPYYNYMTKQNILQKLTGNFPEDKIEVVDMTGQSNHFSILILSIKFKSLTLLERHKIIHTILKDELTHEIHALQIKAFTPDEWVIKNNKNKQK